MEAALWSRDDRTVYQLPIAKAYFPLHEHTAFLLATGLLHDDLDDQLDTLRGALEIDPLLAAWAVCKAAEDTDVRLLSMQGTTRWLAQHLLAAIDIDRGLQSLQVTSSERIVWQKISISAVTVARRAVHYARRDNASSTEHAYWMGMLLGTKHMLDGYASLNGHSPLRKLIFRWPRWLQDREAETLARCTSGCGSDGIAVALAELERGSLPQQLVNAEEHVLWFRPYPEFHALAPQLLKRLQRLGTLEERFDEALQAEKLASLQQLAYGASHEINNPLANISTRAQTLMYNESDAERRRKLLAINDQAFRAYEMIADLMLFAKPPQMELEEVDLRSILAEVRDELDAFARERGIQIRLLFDASPLILRADVTQLGVAFKAIYKNGLESMNDGGVLSVQGSFSAGQRCIQVSVEDQGVGITDSEKRHLFDPFFSGREAGRGLGFGLSKAWRIVEQHHGRIEVSSQRSTGSCFVIMLPVDGADTRLAATNASGEYA